MPIQTKCEHCGFAYISKEEMVGKKVRCRNCGQVFAVAPPIEGGSHPTMELPPESDETGRFPAITMQQSNMAGGVGSAKTRMERGEDPGMFDVAGEALGGLSRPATPFSFPYASLLDSIGPKLLTLVLLAVTSYALFSWAPWDHEPNAAWSRMIPAVLALLLFVIAWMPLIRGAIRQVSSNMNFQLPEEMGIRTAAVASVPFAAAGLFWLAGESVVTFGMGAVLGAALAVPVAIFVYRLRQMEIAHAAIGVVICALIAAAISAGVFAGANYVTRHALQSSGRLAMFSYSPFGPEFYWPEYEEPAPTPARVAEPSGPPIEIRPQQPGPIAPVEPSNPPIAGQLPRPGDPAPQPPVETTRQEPDAPPIRRQATDQPSIAENPLANHSLLGEGRVLQVPVPNGQVIYPLVGSPSNGSLAPINHFAVVRTSAGGDEVSVYRIKPFRQVHAPKPFASTVGGYAISPDGDLLARVTRFGGPSIQVWSYSGDRVVATIGADREPQLLAFIDRALLLCGWRSQNMGPGGVALELAAYDLNTQKWVDYVVSNEPHGPWVSPVWNGEKVSLLTIGASGRDGTVSLRIYPPLPGGRSIFAPIMRREAAAALSPSAIAASPSGNHLAVAFEQEGQLQIAIFRRPDRTPTAGFVDLMVRNHIFPGGLELKAERGPGAGQEQLSGASWLAWLPGEEKPGSRENKEIVSGVLFYKQLAIDPDKGRLLDRLETGAPVIQKPLDAQTMHFVFTSPEGPKIVEGKLGR